MARFWPGLLPVVGDVTVHSADDQDSQGWTHVILLVFDRGGVDLGNETGHSCLLVEVRPMMFLG